MSHFLLIGWVPGYAELLIIAFIALLLFGHRLPSMMRSLGRGVVEFKEGLKGEDDGTAIESDEVKTGEKS